MFTCDCKVWWIQRLLKNDANKQFIIDDSITCDNGKNILDIVIPNCGKTPQTLLDFKTFIYTYFWRNRLQNILKLKIMQLS